MAILKLKNSKGEQEFSEEHAKNILNHPINAKIKDPWKLPSGSKWKFDSKKGELKEKTAPASKEKAEKTEEK